MGGERVGRVQCVVCVACMSSKAGAGYRLFDKEYEREGSWI